MKKNLFILIPVMGLVLLAACSPQKRLARKQHSYMQKSYLELKEAVNEAEVTMLNDTIKVLFPEHLLFALNSSEINTATYPLMQRFANALNKYDKTSILINGYTDKSGTEELNRKLSRNRADSARSLLRQDKVVMERMYTWGHASENPIASNDTEEGKRKNRRVEFIILYNYAPKP